MSECLLRWPPEHSRLASSRSWMHYSSAAAGKTASTARPKWTYLRGGYRWRHAGHTESFQVSVSRSSGSLLSSLLSFLPPSSLTVLRTCFCFDENNRLLFFVFFSLSFSPSRNQALCLRLRQWFPCKITLPTVILHTLLHTSANILHFFLFSSFYEKMHLHQYYFTDLARKKLVFGLLGLMSSLLLRRTQLPTTNTAHQYTLIGDRRVSLLTFCGCWRESEKERQCW